MNDSPNESGMGEYEELVADLLADVLAGLDVYLAFGAYCAEREARRVAGADGVAVPDGAHA